jgi:hypothetical protein
MQQRPVQDPAKKEAYEKYKEQLKAANLWIEPQTYNSWMPAQKKAHWDKVKAKRVGKKACSTAAPGQGPPASIPETSAFQAAAVPPSPPPPYATMAAGHNTANPPPSSRCSGARTAPPSASTKANGSSKFEGSLIDGGCNGGLAGDDVLITETHPFGKVNIIGIGDNLIYNNPMCTAAGLIQTSEGPVIGIMHNYAALHPPLAIEGPRRLH